MTYHACSSGDRIYCIYIAPHQEMIREHARRGGFPADKVSQIYEIIDPATAEGKDSSVRETAVFAATK